MSTAELLAEKLYTPAEAAPLLNKKVRTVWAWIRQGKIKVAPGHRKLITASEVARLRGQIPVANSRQ